VSIFLLLAGGAALMAAWSAARAGALGAAAEGLADDLADDLAGQADDLAELVTPDKSTSLEELDPEFRSKLEALISKLEAKGYKPRINETKRSAARQAWLYASGRTRPGSIVTWVEESNHEDGDAADVIDGRPHPDRAGQVVGWGSWEAEQGADATAGDRQASSMAAEFFKAYGAEAEALGLTWGGRWSEPDLPHVELG